MGRRFARLLWLAALYKLGRLPARYEWGAWLKDFNRYWYSCGRVPFRSLEEFELTRRVFAHAFKTKAYAMPSGSPEAVAIWKDDAAICHLFSFIARREQHPLRFLHWMRWLPWHGHIAEYGAGAAPLADALSKSWPFPRPSVDLVDVDWELRDYCKWRFQEEDKVQVLDPTEVIGPYDAILCVETLEHLPDPLDGARHLMRLLKPGGRLVCDYGPQTKNQPFAPQGMTARTLTINYLKRAGTVLHDGDLLVIQKTQPLKLQKLETV